MSIKPKSDLEKESKRLEIQKRIVKLMKKVSVLEGEIYNLKSQL